MAPNKANKRKAEKPKLNRKLFGEDKFKQAKKLLDDGCTQRDVALKIGAAESTLRYNLKKVSTYSTSQVFQTTHVFSLIIFLNLD